MKRIHSTASHLWYPTLLSEKINIPANGGKIAGIKKGVLLRLSLRLTFISRMVWGGDIDATLH